MKTATTRILTAIATALALVAAPLRADSISVHSIPTDTAPVIGQIPSDQTPVSITLPTPPPEGWAAVEVPGPHTVFVADKDVLKNYDVRNGAQYLASAEADAPVLGIASPEDKTELTGISGRFTQYKLDRPLIGYIRTTPAPAPVVTPAPDAGPASGTFGSGAALVPLQVEAPASSSDLAASLPPAPAPVAPVEPAPSALTPVPAPVPLVPAPAGTAAASQGSQGIPRMLLGTFVSSQQAFRPRRPYDYQLNDDAGVRYAYVDLTRLLLTERIERFIGRKVAVYGVIRAIPGSKDIVVTAETLKLQ